MVVHPRESILRVDRSLELDLLGAWASPDGSRTAFAHCRGPAEAGEDLARALAAELGWGSSSPTAVGRVEPDKRRTVTGRVLVTRAAAQAGELVAALSGVGLSPVPVPAIEVEFDAPGGVLDAAARLLHTYRWVVVTSANGAQAVLEAIQRVRIETRGPSWAAIGPATRRALEREGIAVEFQPSQGSGVAMANELPVVADDRVLVIRGDLADGELAVALRARQVIQGRRNQWG